jgi:outer membrane protein TolC
MQKTTRAIIILSLVFTRALAGYTQSAAPSLSELIDSALLCDYTLKDQNLDIRNSELEKAQLRDAYLPKLQLTGAEAFSLTSISLKTNAIDIPQLNIHFDESRNRFTATSNLVRANAEGSMLIYSGGKIPMLKQAVDEKIKAQRSLTEKQRQDIISDVVSTYDLLALLKQVKLVLDESGKRLAENMKLSEKAFSYGLITKYERQKIEVAQAQLASRIKEYEGKRTVVLEKLFWLTHISIERLMLIDNTPAPLTNVTGNVPVTNRPEIKALDAAITAQGYKIRAEKTWFVPKVQAISSLSYTGSFFGHINSSKPVLPNGANLSSQNPALHIFPAFTVGVGFSWTLLDGRDGKREIEKAMIDLQKAQNNRSDALEKLALNLSKSKTEYTVALAQVTARTKQVETSKNALDQATREFKAGLIRSTQLIDAEEDLEEDSLGLLQAIYDQRRAAIELLKATGSLTIQSLQ